MKTFYAINDGRVLVPMDCIGDELGKCDNCAARFGCYTGALPINFSTKDDVCKHCSSCCALIGEVVNCRVFGRVAKSNKLGVCVWHLQTTITHNNEKPAVWLNTYERQLFERS